MASTGSVTEGLNEPSCTPGAAGANGVSSFEGLLGTVMYDREAADDFNVPASGWQINRVSISAVPSTPGDPNAVTGADIRFLQSNGGSVGALLATATVNTVTRSTGPGTYFADPSKSWPSISIPWPCPPGRISSGPVPGEPQLVLAASTRPRRSPVLRSRSSVAS